MNRPNRITSARFKHIIGEDALVTLVPEKRNRFGFRKVVARTPHTKPSKDTFMRYSYAQTLAYLLFPRNFVKQVGSSIRARTHYSALKTISERSQRAINNAYSLKEDLREFVDHEKRLKKHSGIKKMHRKLWKVGIWVDQSPFNTGFDHKNEPVFFEIVAVNPKMLERYVLQRFKERSLRRRQCLELIGELQAIKPYEDGWVWIHRPLESATK